MEKRDDHMAPPGSGAARKAEIVEAARELYETKGLSRTTVKDVTERVGVARSLFYHYFSSKEELTEAILDTYVDDYVEMVDRWNENRAPGDIDKALGEFVRMARFGLFSAGSFQADLTHGEDAALYLNFHQRATEALANRIAESTAADYARSNQ